jgi:hypothetical protein
MDKAVAFALQVLICEHPRFKKQVFQTFQKPAVDMKVIHNTMSNKMADRKIFLSQAFLSAYRAKTVVCFEFGIAIRAISGR